MTFLELQEKIGTQNKADWHQHKNGEGWVHKEAQVNDSVYIGENAIVFSGILYGNAWVSGDAQVYGNARVYGDAQVYGDAWEKSPLFILGSRHSLTNAKYGHIQIGCHCKEIKWWQENFRDIGKKEGYTPEEIEEYGLYIELFAKVGK